MNFKKLFLVASLALISSTSLAVSSNQLGGYEKNQSFVQVRRNNHNQVVTYLDHVMGVGFGKGISGVLVRQTLNELTFKSVDYDDMNNWETEVMVPEKDGCEFSLKFSPDGQEVEVNAGSCSSWIEFSAKKVKN